METLTTSQRGVTNVLPAADSAASIRAIQRLAGFEPNCTDSYGNQVIDYLVLDSLKAVGYFANDNIKGIKYSIWKTFRMEYEEVEIYQSAKRLEKNGYVNVIGSASEINRGDALRVQLVQGSLTTSLEDNLTVMRTLEQKVYSDWKEELLRKYRSWGTITGDIAKVISSFKQVLSKLLILHGQESVALLYPDVDVNHEWVGQVKSGVINELSNLHPDINALLHVEVPLFFDKQDKNRHKYIDNLFNASFFWHLIQIDEKCSNLIKDTVTNGQVLVLDNTVLFCLVGLDGDHLMESTHNLLKLAQQLGYQLRVTTKTIDEFHESLKRREKHSRKQPPLPKHLAETAANVLSPNHFMAMYWREQSKSGLSMREFIAERSHVEVILKGLQIDIIDIFRQEIEQSELLLDEMGILRASCDQYNKLNEHIVEHDAFHKVLVDRLRGGLKYQFSDASVWFLTHDSKLPVYARASLGPKKALPFCITTSQWIQINRPLLTRTKSPQDHEAAIHNLVTQPFLRTILASFSADEMKIKLINRLSRYSNMTPEIIFRMATNNQFLGTLDASEEDAAIDRKIESKIINLYENLKVIHEQQTSKGNILETEVKQRDNQLIELATHLDSMGTDQKQAKRQIADLQAAFENQQSKTQKTEVDNNTLKIQLQETSLRAAKVEEQLQQEKLANRIKDWQIKGTAFHLPVCIVGILAIAGSIFWQDSSFNIMARLFNLIDSFHSQSRFEVVKYIIIDTLIFGIAAHSAKQLIRRFSKTETQKFQKELLQSDQ